VSASATNAGSHIATNVLDGEELELMGKFGGAPHQE
jgi:hypothetical protein